MTVTTDTIEFNHLNERFADLQILRYKVPRFDELPLNKKILIFYLSEAALSGRDIIYDQNCKDNLTIRKTLEKIFKHYPGDRETDNFKAFEIYLKRVWFSNGIHHHYSAKKFIPAFSIEFFKQLLSSCEKNISPCFESESFDEFKERITSLIFDESKYSCRIVHTPGMDIIANSANNFYEKITKQEVIDFYNSKTDKSDLTPLSYGLNSKLIKSDRIVQEQVYKIGGLYSAAIEKIVFNLTKALDYTENESQKKTLGLLIEYYKTGDLKIWDDYNIEWLKDTQSDVDTVNGFIEVYGDPLGFKGAYEAIVFFKDLEATKRIALICENAPWFEENSPIDNAHKKTEVKGISAKVITVVAEAGDSSPATPIGINLPNADWIRKLHGSKSVNLGNIVQAYNVVQAENGMLEEFACSIEEIARVKKYGAAAGDIHTDLHEVIGHGSGQILEGVATPTETLKNYHSVLEEARADLVALYYMPDNKLIEIGIAPNEDFAKAEYDSYIRNGLMTQLARIDLGDNLEQAHMRCRQLISKWAFVQGQDEKVIERFSKEGKTYFSINNYNKLRQLFGKLLKEVQRIKSEGDYEAGKELVESFAVKIEIELHKEVVERYKKLNLAPYYGFINPVLNVEFSAENNISDIKISFPDNFSEQMMYYSENYSHL